MIVIHIDPTLIITDRPFLPKIIPVEHFFKNYSRRHDLRIKYVIRNVAVTPLSRTVLSRYGSHSN